MKTLLLLSLVISFQVSAQTITGNFPGLANQQVKLAGFDGFDIYTIDSVKADANGFFQLSYAKKYYGMGYLTSEKDKSFIVILDSGEDIAMEGESLDFPETIVIKSGKQNHLFEQYASGHPRREQALSAWVYLQRIYQQDPLFSMHEKPKTAIEAEMQRIKEEDKAFLASLDPNSYVSWFLPVRKLVSSVPTIAQYRTAEIPATIAAFRNLDHTDPMLHKSGLLRETIESHFWLIENSGRSLDSVFIEMNISIDHLVENLSHDKEKLNLITSHLFELLEQRSLFSASEYLAIKLLNQNTCAIDDNFARQLESYRAMKIGNIAPDILLEGDVFRQGASLTNPKRLSDVEAAYKLVVFGSSWCPMCPQELSQIQSLYTKWKAKGVEVVFVSLDTDVQEFKNFSRIFSFISFSNYRKWETPALLDYYVFATPTMFLLDADRKILLRPNSVRQMDAWVDFYIGR